MNNKLLQLKRIFILGIICVFFGSSYLHAQLPKPRPRGHAHVSVQRDHHLRRRSQPHRPATAPATTPVHTTHPGTQRPATTTSNDLTAQVNAEVARQTQARAKRKTKQEWINEYNAHPEELHKGTPMYNAFQNADQRVKKAEQNNETVDPLDKQMSDIYRANTRRNAEAKTKQEWLDEYNAHPEELHAGTPMYTAFVDADRRVKKAEQNNEIVDPLDKQMSDIYRANTKRHAEAKTPREWINEYNAHPEELRNGTPMYNAFVHADQRVKKAEENHEAVDPLDKQMSDIYRANLTTKTPQEWIDEYNAHPEELHAGTPMYNAFVYVDQRVKRAEQNNEMVDPLDKQMSDIYRANTKRHAEGKTPQEWIDEYNAHPEELHYGTPMYNAFVHADQRVKKAEQNNETVDPLDRQMSDIYRENLTQASPKTKQEWIDEYNAHPEELHKGTPMYAAFREADQRVKRAEQNNEMVDPLDKQMSDIYRANTKRIAEAKTTQEVYDILLQYIRETKSYPKGYTPEYRLVYNRFYGKTEEQIKADPELNRLYKLDQLARAAQRGEKPWEVFDRDNPLRRPRLGEQQSPVSQTEESAPGTEGPTLSSEELRQAYNEMPADIQTAIRLTEEHYEQVWENFPDWIEQNKSNIILTPDTKNVFDALAREVRNGRWDENIAQIISDLDAMQLGTSEDGAFYRVIYRGYYTLGRINPDNFHLVAEEQGVELADVNAIIAHQPAHIRLFAKEGKLTQMVLEKGVTQDDIRQVIDSILLDLGEDWTVRMGSHETGTKPHIHFEWVDAEGFDSSYTLQLDVDQVIPAGPYGERQQAFTRLFRKYMMK